LISPSTKTVFQGIRVHDEKITTYRFYLLLILVFNHVCSVAQVMSAPPNVFQAHSEHPWLFSTLSPQSNTPLLSINNKGCIGTKRFSTIDIQGKYVSEQSEGLFFIATLVDEEEYAKWANYCSFHENRSIVQFDRSDDGEVKRDSQGWPVVINKEDCDRKNRTDGVFPDFLRGLRQYERAEVWVIYAINNPEKDSSAPDLLKNVEMAFACITEKKADIQSHIGIHRNFFLSAPRAQATVSSLALLCNEGAR
jgi:hypothetical protein